MSRADKNRFTYISVWVQESLVFLACFFYLLLQDRPILILEAHPPVFLKGMDFLYDFLKIPGGLVNWLSALLMQFWFSDLLSALFLDICFWIVGFLTRKWIETLTEHRPVHTFHLIPVGLLLVLYCNYDFDLSATLAININLFLLVLFIRWAPKQSVIRIGLGLVITVLLYWITGGAFLMFAVLYGLEDLFFRRRIVSGLILLLVSALLPFVASTSFFLITLKHSFLHNLTFENPIESEIIAYSIPAYFLLILIITSNLELFRIPKSVQRFVRLDYVWKWIIETLLLLSATILLANESTSGIKKHVFQVNRAVREERWTDVLELTKYCSNETPLILSQSNLALYQTGKLLDSMFAYPQSKGTLGLLMNQTWCAAWPEEASNTAWKLGLVNESLHWAHEALEHKGPTPDVLKRLGMVYMIKGENNAAGHFFLNLKNVPFQNDTAENLLRLNENPTEFAQDNLCKYVRSCMLIEDVISSNRISSLELEQLLKRNPKNKIAFEYLIAYYLLNANINGIWNHLPDFRALNYEKIPRHVQEALIVSAAMTPNFDLNKLKEWIDPITFEHFVAFRKILIKHKENRSSARQELQAWFGDTYWYYMMFVKSTPWLPEVQNEYQ
ncbi:MAG: DUF6057 family protein [Bacteroidota bacterium]